MQRQYIVIIRSGWTSLFLGGMIVFFGGTSLAVADQFSTVQGGYPPSYSDLPSPVPQPTEDAALLLASKTPVVPPPQEEKRSWWSVFSSKKASDQQATEEETAVEPPSTGKFRSSKASAKTTPIFNSKKSKDPLDGGQAEVEASVKEKQYSEADYLASATSPQDTRARNLYREGLLAESQGRTQDAIRAYNGFIKSNERSTANGVLASPYHRLALIAWKDGNVTDADIYFRYAINYALGGNLLIVGGDYAQFLMAKGDYAKAEIILRNALINDPENKRLLLYLGRCVALQKKHQESLRYLISAVGKAQAYQELAQVYRQQGDLGLARVAEEKRNEYLASTQPRPPLPPNGYSMQPMQQQAMIPPGQTRPAMPPVAAYPPNSALGQAAATAAQQPPYPTLERFPKPQETSGGWIPTQQPSAMPQTMEPPVPGATPISKVFHYPANSSSPVYYQYTGNEYPSPTPTPTTAHPWSQTVPQPAATPPANFGWNQNSMQAY